MDVLKLTEKNFPYMVKMRRHFHEYPECGPREQLKTMQTILKELDEMGIPYTQVPGGGIFGYIHGMKEGKTLLLRADMDALPIQESENNLSNPKVCLSKVPGVMHACGHDGHIAMLLTAAKILKSIKKEISGTIVLMFEEGEEGQRNIEKLCAYIAEHDMKFDTCYASHVRWDIPTGKVACCKGSAMSGLYHFILKIKGRGGHGSRPDLAHGVIDCFHEIYESMNSLRLRYVRPDTILTWSIGKIQSGSAFNLIPDELICEGSIRMMEQKSGEIFLKEFQRIVDLVCPLNYCKAELRIVEHLMPTINNSDCRDTYYKAVEKYIGKDAIYECKPWMASESFSYLCNMFPGVESFVGIKNDKLGSGANHHTPEFDMDERGLIYGAAATVGYALEYLSNTPDTSDFVPAFEDMSKLVLSFC